MTKGQRKTIYKAAVKRWGMIAQMEMAQEEATELALAVRKFTRQPSEDRFKHLAEEIADNEIMIEQMKTMYPKLQAEVNSQMEYKLDRLQKRIGASDFELT